MNRSQLASLRVFSLVFLLPGLVLSAMLSTHYPDALPRRPAPEELRMTPRSIHGVVVCQTDAEDRRLSLCEDASVGIFVVGLLPGAVYLEKWGSTRVRTAEEDRRVRQHG